MSEANAALSRPAGPGRLWRQPSFAVSQGLPFPAGPLRSATKKRLFRLLGLIGLLAWLPWPTACRAAGPVPPPTFRPLTDALGTPETTLRPVPTLSAAAIEQGAALYQIHCAACHGPELEGQANWQQQNEDGTFRAPPHDVTGHTWHHADADLLEAIRLGGARLPANIGGTSPMPPYETILTTAEMEAILIFLKSSWPEDIQAAQWEISRRRRP